MKNLNLLQLDQPQEEFFVSKKEFLCTHHAFHFQDETAVIDS